MVRRDVMAWLTPAVVLSTLAWAGGCNKKPSSISDHEKPPRFDIPAPPSTNPEILLDNLSRAMNERDADLYETLLDQGFLFTESDCQGKIIYQNDREEELAVMGGSRDGSSMGIFTRYRAVEYEFALLDRNIELGSNHPGTSLGDPDGHPEEDWVVFRGRTQILLVDEKGDAFRLDQIMDYKVRQEADGLWRLVRWVDEPLSTGMGCDSSAQGAISWGKLKAS